MAALSISIHVVKANTDMLAHTFALRDGQNDLDGLLIFLISAFCPSDLVLFISQSTHHPN